MKRWSGILAIMLIALIGVAVAVANLSAAHTLQPRAQEEPLTVQVVPYGPSQETIDAVSRGLVSNRLVNDALNDNTRLLSFELVDSDARSSGIAEPPSLFRATYYDYTANKAVYVEGSFDRPEDVRVTRTNDQPLPNGEEFEAAVNLLRADRRFGSALRNRQYRTYPPMPATLESRNGEPVERTVMVGLLATNGRGRNEIVGVNMVRRTVVRYPEGAPETSTTSPDVCAPPSAGQGTQPRGTAWAVSTDDQSRSG